MKRIIGVILLLLVLCFYFVTDNNLLSNDYYQYINKDFFSKNHLSHEDYTYSTFTVAQEESDEVLDGIVNDVVNGKINTLVNDKIKILYDSVIDYDTRNSIGLGSLKMYIDLINNSNNINELINNSIVVEKELGVDIFTRVMIDKDFVDNSKMQVYLYPITFAFGSSSDYFVDEDYMAYKAYIKRAIVNLLEEYGYNKSEARMISSEVISFYTSIGSGSKLADSFNEVEGYYNIVDRNYIDSVYSKIDIVSYFDKLGIKRSEYSLVDESQYRKINEFLTDEYLMVWKKVILVKILSSYASYLDEDYRGIVVDLNNSLTGSKEKISKEDEATDIVSSVFSLDLDKVYESKVITDNDKKYLNELFLDIKKSFREILKNSSWLSDETLEYALVKLDNMKVYVGGYNYSDTSYIDVSGDSLVDKVISINKSSYLKALEMLDSNEDVKAMSESIVNAYYNPLTNSVYIPSSVMFLLKNSEDYYERLGTIGMVIAHEITHGFDYNGSKFDSKGNFNNWWNDEDRNRYSKLVDEVSEYYSGIEVVDGKYIDGEKTVNDNIDDMGAFKFITNVALDNKASKDEMKLMYSSFAEFWKCQSSDEYTKLLLLNDSHSPNKYRVNAVLSMIDEFYDVYKVYPLNDMNISFKDRISVW